MMINHRFSVRAEQELLLKQLGFHENNGVWSSAGSKGGWVHFEFDEPRDWAWSTLGELAFYIAEKCHHEGREAGVRDFKRAVKDLFRDEI